MDLKESVKKNGLLEQEAVAMIWSAVMSAFECNKIQEYCYDNQNFLKCFNKIVLLFYKTEVLSEEVILKWYKDGHVPKGWTVFMEQMKKFIDWLEQAESESEEESDDED